MYQRGIGGNLIKLKPLSLILFNAGYTKIKLSWLNICVHSGWEKLSLRNWPQTIGKQGICRDSFIDLFIIVCFLDFHAYIIIF